MLHTIKRMRKAISSVLIVVGFILSPLSWWNDAIVNIPLAYLFSIPFSFLNRDFFLPSFVLGYLITNVLGFVLVHKGFNMLTDKPTESMWKEIKKDLFTSLVYTLLIALLVYGGIIKPPVDVL